ncbi:MULTISPECIES: hypothetical protein [Nocardiaceae]|uniref:Uncharacterized protein n=1 Tax=Rhodococcoides corynebacterioides TaxID=53972 RepID=A0ABS2KZ63_9NOCA|nr:MULTISPECIES: hypothetical protein [Rhodococcus]MBM7417212.1 hypothetical protein [Rhodococcus corynebacterioides]MBP1115465.1 hypothetical protein [Rhodococcus sp. PvP016]
MWWFIIGFVAVWMVVSVVLGVRVGHAIHVADVEEDVEHAHDVDGDAPLAPTR